MYKVLLVLLLFAFTLQQMMRPPLPDHPNGPEGPTRPPPASGQPLDKTPSQSSAPTGNG